ncbi:MAG: IS200/IS605 family transposase [Armatimonadetes bacterium ATM1]|nr:IS200/IS605 family transposase [Armatimonadetes bacterium ATM1]RIJ94838.1 MAG: IS200/IS605 family transposase [Armatimonadota bacterium]
MPQSLAAVLIHAVFSTKDRRPWLTPDIRQELHPYLVGVLANIGCPSIQTGGTADHVHTLFRLSRTASVAQVIEKVKTSTSKWVKTKGARDFAWQSGYGAFSVGSGEADRIVAYIRNQEEHHRKVTFQDELRGLLREAGMDFDERYLWD